MLSLHQLALVSTLSVKRAKLSPNMNHVDALDLSECRSEEVISFF